MKPQIIVLSSDDDTTFQWMSNGWNRVKISHTKTAKDLMAKVRTCIRTGKDVPDVIKRLEEAGFEVVRG